MGAEIYQKKNRSAEVSFRDFYLEDEEIPMKLYIVLLSTVSNEIPQIKSYTGQVDDGISHYSGDGFDVIRETANCWYLGNLPYGLPERYRKADEYKMISNGRGVYMFGENAGLLVERWNQSAVA